MTPDFQADILQLAAKLMVSIQSKYAHIDWAAAKRIVLEIEDGARVTLEDGNILVQGDTCTINAGQRTFAGPVDATYGLPKWPSAPFDPSPHAYMVLPVHPEGSLADMAIVGQIHWTMQSLVRPVSIWPVWPHGQQPSGADHYDVNKELAPFAAKMPFSEAFWQRKPDGQAPRGLQGYICALPMRWTEDENNHPEMNMILLTENRDPAASGGSVLASRQPADDQGSVA